MLKVLIADDEYFVREMLKNALDWNLHGYRITGEAENGKQVLRLAADTCPDLVIVDINMPIMSGLEVAKQLHTLHPHICTIIVSGYNDFEFARQALTYKVFDYLLKPINDEALLETVLRVKGEIAARAEMRVKLDRWSETESEWQASRFSGLVKQWLKGQLQPDQVAAALDEYKITLPADHMQCIVAELPASIAGDDEANGQTITRMLELGKKLLSESGLPWHAASVTEPGKMAFIVGSAYAIDPLLPGTIQDWAAQVKELTSLPLSAGISPASAGYGSVPALYQAAANALSRKFFRGHGSIVQAEEPFYPQDSEIRYVSVPKEKLSFMIRSGQTAELRSLLKDYFAVLADERMYTKEAAYWFASEILGMEAHKLAQKSLKLEVVRQTETLEELAKLVITLITELSVDYYQEYGTKKDELIQQSKYLILESLDDPDLTVEQLSHKLFVSASYLSHRFKKVQGVGLNEYINTLRMNKAVHLMNEYDLKLHEIAEKVGYRDPVYFSKCFKKTFQVSFSDYKRVK
ncbi:response regulator [Paenibacillus thalictri]|nr:response regulator [Paenibacillus thalictri]